MHEAAYAASPAAVDGSDPAPAVARRRIDDQIDWYDRKSGHNQRWFKRLNAAGA